MSPNKQAAPGAWLANFARHGTGKGQENTMIGAGITARQETVTCPGRRLTPGPGVRARYGGVDAGPVLIRLSMLRIHDILPGGVSGEVLTRIGPRWKRESPLSHAVLVTHANGSSGSLADEVSYAIPGDEIQTARTLAELARQT